jgi:hypothetical protein
LGLILLAKGFLDEPQWVKLVRNNRNFVVIGFSGLLGITG